MTTFNFREPGEFGDGATMTESNVSDAELEAACTAFGLATTNWFDRGNMRTALRAAKEALALRTPSDGEVENSERLNLHRKVIGMMARGERHAGVMLSGRDLHVIAEALLDRAIATEKAALTTERNRP